MKRGLSLLIICLLMTLISPIMIHAEGNYEYTMIEDGTYAITSYTGSDTDITIPDTYNGAAVTVIAENVFKDHEEIVTVTIPESIRVIKDGAFVNCTNLSCVNMNRSVATNLYGAFSGCDNLNSDDILGAYLCGTEKIEAPEEEIQLAKDPKDTLLDKSLLKEMQIDNNDHKSMIDSLTVEEDLIVNKDVAVTLIGNTSVVGDIYLFGTLINEGELSVGGTIYCLNHGEDSAGEEYNYGFYKGEDPVSGEFVVSDTWIENQEYTRILMVGNSFTYRASQGYGFATVLAGLMNSNNHYGEVDYSVSNGDSLSTIYKERNIKEKPAYNDYLTKIDNKEYDYIVMQGPKSQTKNGVDNDDMLVACSAFINALKGTKSENAKVVLVATYGSYLNSDKTIRYLDDADTKGVSEGWHNLAGDLKNKFGTGKVVVVDGGVLATVFQAKYGKRVICGTQYKNEDDPHPSWLGSYAMTAPIYQQVFGEKPKYGVDYSKTVRLNSTSPKKESLKSIVGIGVGNYVSIPTFEDTENINGMLDGCAAFYEPQMTQYLVDGSCSNGLFIYPSGKAVYDSSDPAVASVSSAGKVTFHAIGSTDIIAKISGTQTEDLTASYKLKVSDIHKTTAKWNIPIYYVTYGTAPFANKSLVTSISSKITYSGNNSSVVSVDPKIGTMTFKGCGKATITANVAATDYATSAKASFTLIVNPKGTYITSFTRYKNAFKVKWKKQATKTKGYQIRYSTSSDMKNAKTVTISKTSTTSKKITKLKRKTTYYVQVRTYAGSGSSKYISAWSPTKTVKTK